MRNKVYATFCLLIFNLISGKSQICFNPITNYQVGIYPCSITTADFNNDGVPDLATANHSSNNVSVLLGLSAGTYTWVANYTTGNMPLWITTADYNNDGNADLATSNEGSHNVSVFLGSGTGTFAPAIVFPTRGEASSLTSADLNGDANMDIAVTNAHYDSVSVHLGDGTGNFTLKGYYNSGAGGEPEEVVSSDVNYDGNLDLIVDNWADNIAVLLGDGTGAFGAPTLFFTTGNKTTCAIVGDFNSDGIVDLAACNYFSNDVSFMAGDGTGNFATSVNFPVGGVKPYTLYSDDFNADGNLDLVTANEGSNNISVLLGDGQGNFSAPSVFSAGVNTEQTITGDFNLDGLPDIAAANFGSNQVTVFLNAPAPVVTATAYPDTVCAGDMVTLTGGGALTYAWSNGVSNAVPFAATTTTNYTVTGSTNTGCTNWDTVTVTVNICTGKTSALNDTNEILIYPNPAKESFMIEGGESENELIQIFDGRGKLVYRSELVGKKTEIETTGFDSGIYNVMVSSGKVQNSKRLVILK